MGCLLPARGGHSLTWLGAVFTFGFVYFARIERKCLCGKRLFMLFVRRLQGGAELAADGSFGIKGGVCCRKCCRGSSSLNKCWCKR